MKINDRIKLLMLAAKDLEEAVNAYVKAREQNGSSYVFAGSDVPLYYSKESIERRIVGMRQDLHMLRKELRK